MLRVVLNAASLRVPLTGVGQYTLQISRALMARQAIDLTFFDGRGFSRELPLFPSAARGSRRAWVRDHLPGAYAVRRLLEQYRFDARREPFALYHEPNALPLAFPGPTVFTAHDLSWLRHPDAHPASRVRDMNRNFPDALRRATVVITGSEFVRRELEACFGSILPPVEVIPHGRDADFSPMDSHATLSTLAPLGLSHGRYFLCVGTIEPRKNVRTVLDAHAALPAEMRRGWPLVFAGLAGWGESPLERHVRSHIDSAEVRVLGYISRPALAQLTAAATASVYPSLYEGFGLPALEAMACSVPVIAADSSSLPEVVGDGGLLVPALDTDGFRDAMLRFATDDTSRAEFAERALRRAQAFSWSIAAERTEAAYRRAALSVDAE